MIHRKRKQFLVFVLNRNYFFFLFKIINQVKFQNSDGVVCIIVNSNHCKEATLFIRTICAHLLKNDSVGEYLWFLYFQSGGDRFLHTEKSTKHDRDIHHHSFCAQPCFVILSSIYTSFFARSHQSKVCL